MMTRTLVAAVAALFTVISVPASAQQENATRCPGGKCRPIPPPPPCPGGNCRPIPPPQPPIYTYPQFDYSQQQPRLCVEIGVGLAAELKFGWPHDAAGRRICRVFAVPGSYCECKNWFGEVFSGIVQ
jgi:hypothetical protein